MDQVQLPGNNNYGIPEVVLDRIIENINSFNDLLHLSLINKETYNYIFNRSTYWVRLLKHLGIWGGTHGTLEDLTPLNCLNIKTQDETVAKDVFIKVYKLMSPIVKDLLVDNYNNFQNLELFSEYNTPVLQSKLFANLDKFLRLYQFQSDYPKLIVRFNTILNLFVSSLISEIDIQLKEKNYKVVLSLINAIDLLVITNDKVTVDGLESLLEYFVDKYNDEYINLIDDDISNLFFTKVNNENTLRGVVKGFIFNFEKIDEVLQSLKDLLNLHLNDISKIFESANKKMTVDEIPIILKVMENFVSNHLIGRLFERVVVRSKQIDSLEEFVVRPEVDENRVNSHINIMNEESLFFQCVPYIYGNVIKMMQNLQYPKTEITLDSGASTDMDYSRVVCEFVNYYYEPYLIEFSTELPRQCHMSLIQLINSWQSNNLTKQKNVEIEIMKLVEEDDDENKKSNFEIFNTFTNLFTFKKNVKKGSDQNDQENVDEDSIKLTKMAAKLKILVGKVENMKSLISIDLTVLLLQHIKNSYDLLIGLTEYTITEQLTKQINQACINIFNDMLTLLINSHIKFGFSEALQRLKNYKPVNDDSTTLEPVNNFIELVDVGDLILQMINVFYNHELIQTNIVSVKNQYSRDFLRMNSVEKSIKLMETTLDTYVANGLDVSIDIIVGEIRVKIESIVGSLSINTKPPKSSSSIGTSVSVGNDVKVYDYNLIEELPLNRGEKSEWCEIYISVLENHFKLLQDSIDKSILDVFKQELGDRLITLLIQLLMKKFKISITGGIQFSYDINELYTFYRKHRIKPAIEYLVGFKKVDQLYLVDVGGTGGKRELGKLVVDIGRENGVFTPEEVYQFVTRRTDWDKIRRGIDKVVYGFGTEDCIIM
ncbi:hypothetical protein CANINC_000182 [Pichia inconspicua]|uniref:Exocyst complex component Sec10-like alpha-helical bundle domain-containing protein n=1 Tax=Pichia inconspicua TaxID=52247 RepID=A0A4T0X724_9ASCO|nr:hypothetical protein CANINC_000182 [[Candida] inconspicua]